MPLQARPVPLETYQPRVPVEEGLRRVIPHIEPESFGRPMEQLSGAIESVARGEAARYSMDTVSRSQEQWLTHLKELQDHAAIGAPGFTDSVLKDYQKYERDTLKAAPSPLAQKMMQPHLAQLGLHLYTQASSFEAAARQEHAEATITESRQRAAKIVNEDPGQYDLQLAQHIAGINGLNVRPEVKERGAIAAKAELAHSAALGDLSRDPYAALQNLTAKDKKGYYADLSVEAKQSLFNHADAMFHQRVADAERVERLQEKERQKTEAAVLAKAVTLANDPGGNKLTAQQVQKWGGLFSDNPHGLEFMYHLLSGEDAAPKQTDPRLYADYVSRQAQGEDIAERATEDYSAGRMAHADFNYLMSRNEREHPDWYKTGTAYIKRELNKGMFELNPGSVEADALREFDAWRSEKERLQQPVSIQEGIDKATEVTNFYKARGDQGSPPGGHIAPRFLIGTLDKPDIKATQDATRQAIAQGTIGPEEAGREALRVQMLARMVEQQERMKARAEEKKQNANK